MTADRDMARLWMPSRNVAAGASSRAGLPVWREAACCPHRLSPSPRPWPGSTCSAGSTSPAGPITLSLLSPAGGGWWAGRCRTRSRSWWGCSPSWRFMGGCWWSSTSSPRSVRWRSRWPAPGVSRLLTCRGCRCGGSLTCTPVKPRPTPATRTSSPTLGALCRTRCDGSALRSTPPSSSRCSPGTTPTRPPRRPG